MSQLWSTTRPNQKRPEWHHENSLSPHFHQGKVPSREAGNGKGNKKKRRWEGENQKDKRRAMSKEKN
jgi:hypothetical protein